MSNYFSVGGSVLAVTGVDFSAALGKAVKFVAGVPAVNDSATVPAIAIVLEGNVAAKQSSLGILGGLPEPVLVQIAADSAALYFGDSIMQKADGTWTKDTGIGARCVAGMITDALGAVSGQLVSALVYRPVVAPAVTVVAAPAAAAPADGVFAALNSTAVAPIKADFDALLAQCEILRDSHAALVTKVTAMHAADVTQGVITAA